MYQNNSFANIKTINLLHVTGTIEIGGLETLIVEISKKLSNKNFKIHILCLSRYDKNYVQKLKKYEIEVFLIRKKSKFDLSFFIEIRNLIKRKNINVIHAHSGFFFYSSIFKLLSGVKNLVYTAHGIPVLNRVQDYVEDNISGIFCNSIVAVSYELVGILKKRIPFSKKKVSLIINGIDTDCFCPNSNLEKRDLLLEKYKLPKEFFLIGTVGRLDPVKNYSMLIRSFSALPDSVIKKSYLVFIGDGRCRSDLESLARKIGIEDRLIFLGVQYQVQEILPLLDVFVLSSLTEGTSIALLEAQACGVPAVVTDVGGNGVVVRDGINGFVCPLHDEQAMTLALERLQSDPCLARAMGEAARSRVLEEFDLNTMVRRYKELYRRGLTDR